MAWWLLAVSYPAWVALGLVGSLGETQLGFDAALAPDGRMVITSVRPGGAAWESHAKAGDELLEIDGVKVDQRRWFISGDSGTAFRVLTIDGNVLSGPAEEWELPTGPLVASFVFISFVFAATGAAIFLRSDRSTEILTVSSLFLVAAFAVAPASARSHPWAVYVQGISLYWTTALFFVFFSLFSGQRRIGWSLSRFLRWGMVVWATALSALFSLSIAALPGIYGTVRGLAFVELAVGLLGGVVFLVISYLGNRSPVMRERLRIIVFGVVAAIVPFVVLSIVPSLADVSPFVRPEITVLGMILVPLSFGYAIMRHQLMAIRRLVHRGAAYALISVAIFVIYGALIATLRVAGGSDISQNVTIQMLLLAVLFAAIPFISGTRRVAFAAVDRLLYREYVDHQELTRRVSAGAAHVGHIDELAGAVLGTIVEELRLGFAAFIEVFNGRPTVKASVGPIPEQITQALRNGLSPADDQAVSLSTLPVPGNDGQAAIVKVRKEAEYTWVLCLGPKLTEEPFQREDLDMAQAVASHVATIVEKLHLLDELRLKAVELRELNRRLISTQETERSRVALYLHDDPLQQITSLIWRYSDKDLPLELQDDLQHIAEGLRNFSAGLHPGVLEDLGLEQALLWLGSEASASSGFEFVFDIESNGRKERLDPEIELALYRIAQEALTNCQRHANATKVSLRLALDDDNVTLTVEDDGVGFRPMNGSGLSKRLGLVGMRERAEQHGGSVKILPGNPSATNVLASIPVKQGTTTPETILSR